VIANGKRFHQPFQRFYVLGEPVVPKSETVKTVAGFKMFFPITRLKPGVNKSG